MFQICQVKSGTLRLFISFAFSLLFLKGANAQSLTKINIESERLGSFSLSCEKMSEDNYTCREEVADIDSCTQALQDQFDSYDLKDVCESVINMQLSPVQFSLLKQVFTDLYEGDRDDGNEISTVISYVASFSPQQISYYRMLSQPLFSSSKDDLDEFEAIAGMALSFSPVTASFYQLIAVPLFSSSKDDLEEVEAIFSMASDPSLRPCFSTKVASLGSYSKDDLDEVQAVALACQASPE